MQQTKQKILVISHEATLTGAPILLLNLLQCLYNYFEFTIVLKRGGDVEKEFEQLGKTYILKHTNYSKEQNIFIKIFDRIIYFFKQIQIIIPYLQCNVVLSNTVCNGRLLKRFSIFRKPILLYVHELESMIQYFNKYKDAQFSLRLAQVIFYPSIAVQNNLIQQHKVAIDKTSHLPYYFPKENFKHFANEKLFYRKFFLEQYSIPQQAFLVVGMGMVSERKGTHHFIEVALETTQLNPNIYFVWVGDFNQENYAQHIKNKFFDNHASKQIIFTGKLPYSTTNLLPFDLFFLSSIEDPYPLVVLEAAYQNVPTICYNNSGGIVEFIGSEYGFAIEKLSIQQTTKKVLEIAQQPFLLKEISKKLKERVITLHSNQDLIQSTFMNSLL